jgi:spermidine synthase
MVKFAERQNGAIQLFDLQLLDEIDGPIQNIRIFDHAQLGRVLVIDGELQHVQAWQELYHEPLVHLPASFIPSVSSVLILGGGCLYAAAEVLKYSSVSRLDIVEYDRQVIDLMLRHYGHATNVVEDPRVHILIEDARHAFEWSDRKYDLIIGDCFDLSCERIGRRSAYRILEELLTPNGLCSDVLYRHMFETETMQRSMRALAQCSNTRFALICVPEYPGAMHIHVLWGRNTNLNKPNEQITNLLQRRHIKSNAMDFQYYDPSHRSHFLYLPPYVSKVLRQHQTR